MELTPCKYLRNKRMYVPEQADRALSNKFDPQAFAHCWCNKTLTEVGADDQLVKLHACSNPERRCYTAS